MKATTIAPPKKYRLQEFANKITKGLSCFKILLLRTVHVELNPIEHVCGIAKRAVATQT